jgi:tetratricopeptide (TPR) repeat protein
MIRRPDGEAPAPLSSHPELGALLSQANEEYAAGLDEAAAYRRIQQQLAAAPAARKRWPRFGLPHAGAAGAVMGALALAGGLLWLRAPEESGPTIVFGPEGNAGARAPARGSRPGNSSSGASSAAPDTSAPSEEAPASAERAEPGEDEAGEERELEQPERRASDLARPARPVLAPPPTAPRDSLERPEPKQRPERAEPEPSERPSSSENEAKQPDVDCLKLANEGSPQQADSCFAQRAAGSGLRAEMALYEMARLRRDSLGDGNAALSALSEYRQRFPGGTLRHEVDVARVELLVRLGRTREALRESEELLASPAGRARAAELHVLRGNMYRTALSDPRSAEAEFASAERLGGALGAEATYLRGTCLEALGESRAALEVYQRYLSKPDRPRAAEARKRVAELTGSARGLRAPPP